MLFNFLSSAPSQTYFRKLECTMVSGGRIPQIGRKVTHFHLIKKINHDFQGK